MADPTFHSALSPSARHRWGVCPGSIREEAKFPEESGGSAANDGTRTHTLLERAIKFEFIDKEGQCGPAPFYGMTVTDAFGTYTVDIERAKRLNVALEYIREFVAEHGGNVISERRVHPDGLVRRADMSGTVDVQITGKFVYVVMDFKDGISPVGAQNNPQLEQYAMGVLAGLAPENYPKRFRLVICQPKLALKGMPIISTWEITPEELLARVPVIIAQAAATDAPDAPLVPGDEQCKYCKAKGSCPAIAGKAMAEVGLMFSAINHPATPSFITPAEVIPPGVMDLSQQAAAKDPTQMDVNQLRQVMEAAPLVRQFLASVEERIESMLKAGVAVPGFKLVQGAGRRAWAFPEEEMVKKLTGMGIPKGSVYEQSLVSPAKAEKLVWDKKGEPQQLSDTQKKRMNNEYVKMSQGKLTVAPESDSRPAVVADASSLFAPTTPALPAFLSNLPGAMMAPLTDLAQQMAAPLPPWLM